MDDDVKINFINSIEKINSHDWHSLNNSTCPFLRYDFFSSLEKSHCANSKKGWQAHHLVAKSKNEVTIVMPMYLKNHSWGEYVFDWAWADAFKHHNIDYYPKLVATIPFTPVNSNKFFSSKHQLHDLFQPLIEHCQKEDIKSWHILYCKEVKTALPKDVYHRNTIQFHWFNREYKVFDDFLSTLASRKRKNIRKERLSIIQQNIKVRLLKNNEITQKDLEFFYLTYQLTYLKRGHQPHLNFEFFKLLLADMAENMLLIIASHTQEDIACSLFFYDDNQLYGRYWGCTKQYKNLHFELCYYLGIEFCINNNLKIFKPGTQGEHKIQRGFEPVLTHSYHWIKHPDLKEAIKNFCKEEQKHMLTYQQQCRQKLPFKKRD